MTRCNHVTRHTRDSSTFLLPHYCTDTAIAIAMAASRCMRWVYGVVVCVCVCVYPFRSDIDTVRQYCAVPYRTIYHSHPCFFSSVVMLYFMSLGHNLTSLALFFPFLSCGHRVVVWSCGHGRRRRRRRYWCWSIWMAWYVSSLLRSFLLRISLFFTHHSPSFPCVPI